MKSGTGRPTQAFTTQWQAKTLVHLAVWSSPDGGKFHIRWGPLVRMQAFSAVEEVLGTHVDPDFDITTLDEGIKKSIPISL